MIEDKSLQAAIRREAKSGITIYAMGEDMVFIGMEWMARTNLHQMRNELRGALGEVVEMLGFIPENESLVICKVKGEFTVQNEMQEVTANRMAQFIGEPVALVGRTLLSHGWAGRLWQAPDKKLYGQATTPPGGLFHDFYLNTAGCIMAADDDTGEAVYVRATRPEEGTASEELCRKWEHLERVWWLGEEEPETPEETEDGQMEMEEG